MEKKSEDGHGMAADGKPEVETYEPVDPVADRRVVRKLDMLYEIR
jgi:hypothetical protein